MKLGYFSPGEGSAAHRAKKKPTPKETCGKRGCKKTVAAKGLLYCTDDGREICGRKETK